MVSKIYIYRKVKNIYTHVYVRFGNDQKVQRGTTFVTYYSNNAV